MLPWQPPEGVSGAVTTIVVTAAAPRGKKYKCAMAEAIRARPGLRVRQGQASARERLQHFTLGPFMESLDAVERQYRPLAMSDVLCAVERNPRLHDGLKKWTSDAVRRYVEVFSREDDTPETRLRLVPKRWTYRVEVCEPGVRGAYAYEISAWGRCYESVDRRVRELRLIGIRADAEARADAEVAIAAFVAARATPDERLERVRVVAFTPDSDEPTTLFDDTPQRAVSAYEEHGRGVLAEIVDGHGYQPGTACLRCAFASRCPALPRANGLLGVDGSGRPRRTWSVTTGRAYQACPARAHLRGLNLPTSRAVEHSDASRRGRAIHALLAARHADRTSGPCVVDLGANWSAGGHELTVNELASGREMLRHHAEVCPLQHLPADAPVRVEPRLTWEDGQAQVLVIAEPDLLYRDGDSWVWREVKTSAREHRGGTDLLSTYPQLALGVLVLARGELGGSRARSRVELEVLRPGGVDLEVVDPFTPRVRQNAEAVIRDMVHRWRADDLFAAQPAVQHCTRCEVAAWCRAKDGAVVR
ncbi:PD-(D/E)XK nuclease family protein [Goodfellowiella coeruleoviolacea]|uniref:PD-(D/E)XK nuclease superfamily protein n=1 Tax=Goodfellowiella coeruleoviolacea TaxID=334858 RepID=A0AAE3KM22_9PSEU|nr:PD-(D/E)XK nuclease family protein [Goodfellowiella coeruleoviolacea]MCP2167123.1 PD-(D/E)XK nuclease superfamily protein [Goodfellowiella coeruleoviolacea]